MKEEKCIKQKNQTLNKGFTLIELLVVVLIIGIIAAIALPQYQLARDKAEFMKYQAMVSSLRNAYNEYVLLHGNGTDNFDALSLNLPSNFTKEPWSSDGYRCVSNDDMFCCMSPYIYQTSALLNCGKKDLSVIYQENFFRYDGTISPRVGYCYAEDNNARAKKLCDSMGIKKGKSNTFTPSGYKNKYAYYELK